MSEISAEERRRRSHYGREAIRAGTPDFNQNGAGVHGWETDAADAIANVLHAIDRFGGNVETVLADARMHWEAERA